jgi:hypothetical protein
MQEADPTSNLEFSRAFRCSRRFCLRSAPRSLASSNLLGAEKPTFELDFDEVVQKSTFDHEAEAESGLDVES